MARRGLFVVLCGVGLILGGCMQATLQPASEANFTARDRKLLAAAPYAKATIPEPYRRQIVQLQAVAEPGSPSNVQRTDPQWQEPFSMWCPREMARA